MSKLAQSPESSTNLEFALQLARAGWAVFPVWHVRSDGSCACDRLERGQIGKHPRCAHGHNDATTDETQIRRWWSEPERGAADAWQCDPESNIGIAVPDGIVIVDVDPRNGGVETLEKVCAEHGGAWLESLTVESGGGGIQVYLSCGSGRRFPKNLDAHFGPGVDLKQRGGYVLAPPSNHKSGGEYSWQEGPNATDQIARAPAWLTLLGKVRTEKPIAAAPAVPDGAELDDELRERLDRAIELIEPHFAPGSKHQLALAIGGYLRNRKLPALAARYVVSQLPSTDPSARVNDALWAWSPDVTNPRGASDLREIAPDLLAELDALGLDPQWTRRVGKRRAERAARKREMVDDDGTEPLDPDADAFDVPRPGYDPAVDFVISHLAMPEAGVFQRSGTLVVVTREARDDGGVIRPGGAPTIREIVPARLKEIIRTTAGPREASLAGDVIARGEWSDIRPLDAIVSYPVMRADGTLLTESGYDAATRTLADIAIEVDTPESPTRDDARAALATLSDLVSDFPFAGDEQRSAWLAMLLTVPARPAIDGPTPLGLLEATQRGSGKTLLADVLSMVVTGEVASRRVAPKTREEWDKVLFSILLAGDPLVLFDNVTNMLASDALDAVLTGTTYAQRLLGVSEDRRVAVRTVFLASANNARLSTDLVRRSVGCRLEPDVEQPEARTGFRYVDLLGHVRRERARYLGAVLTVLRAYALAGRPAVEARPMGSYGAWCRVVRDALVWAGGADPAATQDALRETADVERDELRDLLSAWHGLLGERAVTVRELLEAARSGSAEPVKRVGGFFAPGKGDRALWDALSGVMPNAAEPSAHAIGNRLRTLRGQIIGGLVLKEGPRNRTHVVTWQVRRLG